MDMEKFTDRSRGFIQAAQSLAVRNSNQFLMPEHLLKVMTDDDNGLAVSLLSQAGTNIENLRLAVDADIEKLPKIEGSSVQVSASQGFLKALDLAQLPTFSLRRPALICCCGWTGFPG